MAIAYTGTQEFFTACPDSPSADEALLNLGDPITLYSDLGGVVALGCIKTNRLNPDSAVVLDDSVEPPALHLSDAVAVIHSVRIDPQTSEPTVNYCDRAQRVVNGTYRGPGSILSIL